MTSISPTNKQNLGVRQVPLGYSLTLTIIGMKDERCLGTWALQYTLMRCSNIHTWFLVSNDIKIQVWGTRPFHAISRAQWFALHFLTHDPISLIMFKNSKYANQT